MSTDDFQLKSGAELAELYRPPSERALKKQIDRVDEHCMRFIGASPLVMLATCGSGGADCSPRGGDPGFVVVADERTLLLPDHRGNNRLDSLRNILHNPAVGLLFIVPGVHETLRVNGTATVSREPALRARLAAGGQQPTTVIRVHVEEAFIQCSRALVRADVWNPATFLERSLLPSLGQVLADHTRGAVDAAQYDRESAEKLRSTLY